jgi:hypothetical protein
MLKLKAILYISLIAAFIIATLGGMALLLGLDGRLVPMLFAFALILPIIFGLECVIEKAKKLFR